MKSLSLFPLAMTVCALANPGCVQQSTLPQEPRAAALTGPNKRDSAELRPAEAKGAQVLKDMQPRPSEELTLPSEMDIPAIRNLAQAWASRSETLVYEMTHRNGVPARMAIREIHGDKVDTVYVCIAGLFSDSQTWKYVIGALEGQQEVWAVDLVGTGLSDCPDPDQAGRGGYSPEAHAERVLQALRARLAAHPAVSRLIVAGHSLGGLVTLRMFMNEDLRLRYADVLGKVQGLALFAPSDVVVTQPTESWKSFIAINGMKAGVGSALQILQYQVVQALRESFCNPDLASREVADYSIKVVRDSRYRRATQATMRDAVPWRVFIEHTDFETGELLEAAYQSVTVPCLLVWGKCDESLPVALGYKIKDQLPDARLVLIPHTKHLLTLERPRVCAEMLRQFQHDTLNGRLAAAHTVQTLDLNSFEDRLLVGSSRSATGVAR
jgi:pimeloyl-ACP methyl ester carboxylesterase